MGLRGGWGPAGLGKGPQGRASEWLDDTSTDLSPAPPLSPSWDTLCTRHQRGQHFFKNSEILVLPF